MRNIDGLLEASKAAGTRTAVFLPTYRDPDVTSDEPYWGAIKPVIQQRSDGEQVDTRWLVLVQEKAGR